jgi:ADP-heptose:LPS heptosyltransferase
VKFLIPEFTGLGDVIQKTPMIRAICELDHDAHICLVGDNRWGGLDVLRGSSFIHEICNVLDLLGLKLPEKYTNRYISILYNNIGRGQRNNFVDWLNGIDFDVFLDSYQSDVPIGLSRLIRESVKGKVYRHLDVQEGINYGKTSIFKKRKITANLVPVPILKGRHDIDSNFDLLEYCLGRPISRVYDTWTSLGANPQLLMKWGLNQNDYICIQPGAANGAPTPKTWHPENFVNLSVRLIDRYCKKIVLLGDSGDQDHIISKKEWPTGVVNAAGSTSIEELGSLIGNAACVVAHDSGIMHIANAMDIPLVALYGPTDYTATKPLGKKSKTLFSKTAAFAIMYRTDTSELKLAEEYPDNSAMAAISVDEVMAAISELFSNFSIDC